MDWNTNKKELTGILFPGIVKDEEKALQCLGGIKHISQAFSQTIKRNLGLCFNPENPYVKKIYAEPKTTVGFLLKVKVKKKKVNNEIKREVTSTEVLGHVNLLFKFDEMYDFQYLPIARKESNESMQCLLDSIVPNLTHTPETFFNEPVELFVPPIEFTRMHRPQDISYPNRKYNIPISESTEDNVINFVKKHAKLGVSHHIDFSLIDEIPKEPPESVKNAINVRAITNPEIRVEVETLKKFFEDRPIYSFNCIRYFSKVKFPNLKLILPNIAYYMLSGPWRKLWIRHGYDPRKDPSARIYQSLDFRIRSTVGINKVVTTRLETLTSERLSHALGKKEDPFEEVAHESSVIYRPGMIPLQRQIFFQLCDIKLPEIEELLLADPPPGALCHPRWGWLPPDTSTTCRNHIVRSLQHDIFANKTMELKIENPSSDEQSDDEPGTSVGE